MSNTKMKWEANPQGVRKIVMELVSELDPSLLSSPAVEKCIHDITSYANEVANKAVLVELERYTDKSISDADYVRYVHNRIDQLRTKTGEDSMTYDKATVKKYDIKDIIE